MEKKYKVKITGDAYKQIDEVKEYISNKLFAPDAALRLLISIKNAVESLEIMPARHPIVDETGIENLGVRKINVNNFLIYYWIDEENLSVYIIALIYRRRNQNEVIKMAQDR